MVMPLIEQFNTLDFNVRKRIIDDFLGINFIEADTKIPVSSVMQIYYAHKYYDSSNYSLEFNYGTSPFIMFNAWDFVVCLNTNIFLYVTFWDPSGTQEYTPIVHKIVYFLGRTTTEPADLIPMLDNTLQEHSILSGGSYTKYDTSSKFAIYGFNRVWTIVSRDRNPMVLSDSFMRDNAITERNVGPY